MSTSKDVRWVQRFNHYSKALIQLEEAIKLSQKRILSNLELQGLIQAFEFTHELAWNVLKDYIEHMGGQKMIGSKDTTREAFQKGLIQDGQIWMDMILSRNLSSHTYNEDTAKQIADRVITEFYPAFNQLFSKMEYLKNDSN